VDQARVRVLVKHKEGIEKIARRATADDVVLLEERDVSGCSLTIWRGKSKLPRLKAAVLETGDQHLVVSKSLESFTHLLEVLPPGSRELVTVLDLFQLVGPGRCMLLESSSEIAPIFPKVGWHDPQTKDGMLIFYCNDPVSGKIEQVSVQWNDAGAELRHEVASEGFRTPMR